MRNPLTPLTTVTPVTPLVVGHPLSIKLVASLAGALAVALAAQVAIPIPGSPVPFTMQPLAVLIVGGLLGPRFGALSLAMYIAMGAAGLPVFTPFGAPGVARLMGPTGGYLISYPFAAALVGWVVRRFEGPTFRLCFLAAVTGMVVIFIGGFSQLYLLSGSAGVALGVSPFILADIVKAGVAALVIKRFIPTTRALG